MKLVMSAVAAMMVSFAALASGIVTNVSIRQVRPWQGMVEVDYELTEDRSADPGLSTTVTFMDQQNDRVYDAKTFTHPFTYTKGAKRMIWNAAKDKVSFKSSNVVCKVEVRRELYCVIDLSGGPNATSYPVTTLSAVPEGGWTDEYKTSKLVLRYIEPGTFMMGSPTNEIGRAGTGGEILHRVSFTKGFYIGVFEMTQRQWEYVMGTRPSWFGNDAYYAARPVEKVTYNMIRGSSLGAQWPSSNLVDENSFLGKIREKTGLVLDLPTEAQWEYACRAGTTTALNNGKNLTSPYSSDANMNEVGRYWFNGGSSCMYIPSCDTTQGTAKVGSYEPNEWGLYDMHGNVAEWCLDWYQYCVGITEEMEDPVGFTWGDGRIQRGGSWVTDADNCRSADRSGVDPSLVSYSIGLRISCFLPSR